MSWGALFFYYHCPVCNCRFKYAEDMIPVMKDKFGKCPECGLDGVYEQDGACIPDDIDYIEVDE